MLTILGLILLHGSLPTKQENIMLAGAAVTKRFQSSSVIAGSGNYVRF